MYVQREELYPALGKGPELRALLEERVKAQQANGRRITLWVSLFGGPEGNPYILNIQHQDLAAYEAQRRNNVPDPAYQAKLATLLSRPVAIELHEVLIPNPTGPSLQSPAFTQSVVRYPALGKAGELRALLEERVKADQAAGQAVSLRTSVYGFDSQVFTVLRVFHGLAELESRLSNLPSILGEWAAKVAAVEARPLHARLSENVVPMPS